MDIANELVNRMGNTRFNSFIQFNVIKEKNGYVVKTLYIFWRVLIYRSVTILQ